MPEMIAKHQSEFEKFFHPSSRLVPDNFQPECVEIFIEIPPEPEIEDSSKKKKKSTRKETQNISGKVTNLQDLS
jgi:hypothetical protein